MALVGDLKEISIATLLQLNCVEKNTAQLTVSTPKGPAMVFMDKGEIIHAVFAGIRGEEALYRILSFSQGEFRVAEATERPDRTITASYQSLLLEGMRVLDETKKGKEQIASTVGRYLSTATNVESYVVASKSGDILASGGNGCSDRTAGPQAEKLAAAAILLTWAGREISTVLALGEMNFARLANERSLTFFLDCGDFVAVIVATKSPILEPVYAQVDDVRKKLKYCTLDSVPHGVEVFV
jgi:hypothetical protein